MRHFWIFVVLLFVVGCGGRDVEPIREVEDAVLPGDTKPRGEVADAAVADAAVVSEEVRIVGVDGLEIQGELSYLDGAQAGPGVMLLHMVGSNRGAWDGFVEASLLPAGYTVLAIDLRGHGETGGEQDWAAAEEDLLLVWAYFSNLPQVDRNQTAVVGGSIGANLALRMAAWIPEVQTAVLLSPGLDYFGVTTEDALAEYGERPLLIVASNNDSYAAESSQALRDVSAGVSLRMYQQAGHGTRMFAREEGLGEMIVKWLQEHVVGEV